MRRVTRPLPQSFDQLQPWSRLAYHWRAEELGITPLTGQVPQFARASTATGLDRNGSAYTAGWGQPAWAVSGGRVYLRLGSGASREDWRIPVTLAPPDGVIGFADLMDRGGAGDPVLHLGDGTTDTASLTVRQAAGGTWEVAVRHTGGLAVASAPPATGSGDRVRLYWVLTPEGQLQLRVRVDEGPWVTGDPVAGLSLPAAWAAQELRVAHAGSGIVDLRCIKFAHHRSGLGPDE